jgi:hypothetical protein
MGREGGCGLGLSIVRRGIAAIWRALAQAIARPGFAISIARDPARLEALNTNDHRAAAACVFTKKSGHFLVDALNVHILFSMC